MHYLELCKVNVIKPSINFKIKIKITNNLDKEEDLLKSENITLNIDTHLDSLSEININNDHYVSFIMMYHFNYGFDMSKCIDTYLVGNSILCKNNYVIPTYKIEKTEDFKYKKFIRNILINDFKYKNKSITIIKSIGVYENYHNYVVLLNPKSKYHKLYKNSLKCYCDEFKWFNIYDFFTPDKSDKSNQMVELSDVYNSLIETSRIKYIFTDSNYNNKINITDLYRSLIPII